MVFTWLVCLMAPPLVFAEPNPATPTDTTSGPTSASPAAVPAARQATNVAIITINGSLDDTTARSVQRRMQLAARAGADAIVFEIDTPGGRGSAALKITDLIKQSPIKNTVAWVHNTAYSGGAVIALAPREMVTAERVQLGDAIPIVANPITGLEPLPAEERQKILAPIVADLVESARLNGYDEKLVQGLVAIGVELWLIENTKTGQRLCISKDEYRMLFGEPSSGEPTRIPSATSVNPRAGGPNATPSAGAAPPIPDAPSTKGRGKGSRDNTSSPAPAPGAEQPIDEQNKIVPAAPELGAVADAASREHRFSLPPRTRPTLSESDRGQWVVVDKISDGQGPLVFGTSDLLHYGLAKETVRSDAELQAFFGAKHLLRLDQTWSESMVSFLTNFIIRAILVAILLLAIFVAMTHPGLFLPEVIAGTALVALLAPPLMINMANWWEIAAIIAGLVLIATEIFVLPGFGVAGVLGLVLFFGGLIGTFIPQGGVFPDTPTQQRDMLYGVAALAMGVITAGFGMYFISKHFGSIPIFNKLILKNDGSITESSSMLAAMDPAPLHDVAVGSIGRALSPLRPAGRVQLGDRIVDVVAGLGFIDAGETVRVTRASAFQIVVERVAAGGSPPPTPVDRGGRA